MKINLTDIITKEQIDEAERMGACETSIERFREALSAEPLRWYNLTKDEMAWALAQTPELTKALLEAGVDVHTYTCGGDALRDAAERGYTEVVRLLLEAGDDACSCGNAPLRYAAQNGHAKVVKFLLEYGANVHSHNDEALRYAARRGHTEVVRVLLEAGADVYARHYEFNGALHYAARNGHTDVVRILQDWIKEHG